MKEACATAWQGAVQQLLDEVGEEGSMAAVSRAHAGQGRRRWLPQVQQCWGAGSARSFDTCCSNEHGLEGNVSCFQDSSFEACCAFGAGSDSFLKTPALTELRVMVALPTGHLLTLEQDGFLRMFDMATVLWPAGYLLMQWAGTPEQCRAWAGRRVLELGAGVGGPSIAAAACGASVVATDIAQHALLQLAANAALNDVAVEVKRFDWHRDEDLLAAEALGPFDVVLGASLLWEKWYPRLWQVLGRLLGPAGSAALVHMVDSLEAPSVASGLRVERRLSGDAFGMGRADRGEAHAASDWELVLLRRG